MGNTKNIIAISGSTRSQSTNHNYIQAVTGLIGPGFTIHYNKDLITALPHFNPDLDTDTPPEAVTHFRQQLRNADGILICTPEYAMGVPGTLKNAIDWTVSSCEFSNKPVALITASSLGEKAHRSLLETLTVIEARITPATSLLISFAKPKINDRHQITDAATLNAVQNVLQAFKEMLTE
jgi:NAD(P)H-dependent FMN reductase